MGKLILAGDIGGTKTLLQLAVVEDGVCRQVHERRFDSGAYERFCDLVREFMHNVEGSEAGAQPIAAACFGVAGPIHGQSAKITNLPWTINGGAIGAEFGIPAVRLINDFAAVGYGIGALHPEDLVTLQPGEEQIHGTRAVIGAGTGLGEGILVWDGSHYRALPSEGGHVDFAPLNEDQEGLLRYLRGLYGHVSYERIVSGPGLVQVYDFLLASGRAQAGPDLRMAMEEGDPAAALSHFGLEGRDEAAARALEMFVSIYGAQAGNLALTLFASGGLYVAGGIAPKILPKLREGGFMDAFRAKGRFAGLLEKIPVRVVTNPKVGLLGAAQVAARL